MKLTSDNTGEQSAGLAPGSSAGSLVFNGRSRSWTLGSRTLIMGVLNLTPDSFYDGGRYRDKGLAIERAHAMVAEGAEWIDIGGESTRPGAVPVELEVEIKRTISVVEALAKAGLTVSIDTMKAGVARAALEAGAEIVNDVSGLQHDPNMAKVCAQYKAAVILMHMRGAPATMQSDLLYTDIVKEVLGVLKAQINFAVENGIDITSIAVDPGIGFGKSAQGSARLIKELGQFKRLGRPVMVGVSRKSFIGNLLSSAGKETGCATDEPNKRLAGTIAACTASILNGAHILRVHDVKEARDAAVIADAVKF